MSEVATADRPKGRVVPKQLKDNLGYIIAALAGLALGFALSGLLFPRTVTVSGYAPAGPPLAMELKVSPGDSNGQEQKFLLEVSGAGAASGFFNLVIRDPGAENASEFKAMNTRKEQWSWSKLSFPYDKEVAVVAYDRTDGRVLGQTAWVIITIPAGTAQPAPTPED